jgi:hypothetical protein
LEIEKWGDLMEFRNSKQLVSLSEDTGTCVVKYQDSCIGAQTTVSTFGQKVFS